MICLKNHNYASAALNKSLKLYVPDAVVHSFRHSFRGKLKNKGVHSKMIVQIRGWSLKTVEQEYGIGYELDKLSLSLRLIRI